MGFWSYTALAKDRIMVISDGGVINQVKVGVSSELAPGAVIAGY